MRRVRIANLLAELPKEALNYALCSYDEMCTVLGEGGIRRLVRFVMPLGQFPYIKNTFLHMNIDGIRTIISYVKTDSVL